MSLSFTRRAALPLALLGAAVLAACGGGQSAGGPSEQSLQAKATAARPVPVRAVSERAGPAAATSGRHSEAAAERVQPQSKLYIVQMADDPVSAYRGGIAGYAATKPAKGQKLNPLDAAVSKYAGYLAGKHDAALAAVGASGKKAYSYQYVFNGFAAELSEAQVAKLAARPGVIAVAKDEVRRLDTSSTPAFLGLSGAGGVWEGATGENVVIGIIDGGIWPEHPSLSDRTGVNGNATQDGKLGYLQLPGWHGRCVPGEQFTAMNCNGKLIGARYYNAGFGGNAGIDALLPHEFNSPRDFGGHGTHTATTAGGNRNVPATGDAAVFGNISGIAPRARIAAYKVCWETAGGGSCFTTDSVAAIDQAVADGVDVLNFSISGSTTNFLDPVEVAFLFAADAGVFVATSAGNSGPASSTVAHAGPWLTTVAAGTHKRDGQGSVTLGNGVTYNGASAAAPVGPAPLINASAAGLAGANAANLALCGGTEDPETGGVALLDPAKVAGKIVVCDRGVTARINKSLAVQRAGGVGMVLINPTANSINADLHFVPTVHLQNTDRAAVQAYAAGAGATATINASTIVTNAAAPFTAAFSSRGPLRAAGGDLLKPDLMAPGQDVLAGVAPPGNFGRLFDLYSGTSMSSPHVAGLGALMKQLRPGWSPMMIKSALMTTGTDVLDGGTPAPNGNPVLIFRQGAGHVNPPKMNDPGLVFEHGFDEWLAFLCGTGQLVAPYCPGIRIDPSDLNVASIAIGDMAGLQTVKRKVTSVGTQAETYTVSISGMAGFNVALPGPIAIAPGQTKSLDLQVTRTSGTLNAYTGGQLTLTGDQGHVVRIPIVVRPVALAAPPSVSGTGGPISYSVTFGYDGAFGATARGLVPATITAGNVADDPTDSTCSLSSPNAQKIAINVPAGTTYARFSLFDADVNAGSDIDLCVFNEGGTLVGSSGSGTSAEEVNLSAPAMGTYTVVVQGWGVVGSSPFKLHTWLLGSADAGNMTVVAPAQATTGGSGTIALTFNGLAAATRYLGAVAYSGDASATSPTIVRVDTP
jgi:subtilisin family serine protease